MTVARPTTNKPANDTTVKTRKIGAAISVLSTRWLLCGNPAADNNQPPVSNRLATKAKSATPSSISDGTRPLARSAIETTKGGEPANCHINTKIGGKRTSFGKCGTKN